MTDNKPLILETKHEEQDVH